VTVPVLSVSGPAHVAGDRSPIRIVEPLTTVALHPTIESIDDLVVGGKGESWHEGR